MGSSVLLIHMKAGRVFYQSTESWQIRYPVYRQMGFADADATTKAVIKKFHAQYKTVTPGHYRNHCWNPKLAVNQKRGKLALFFIVELVFIGIHFKHEKVVD